MSGTLALTSGLALTGLVFLLVAHHWDQFPPRRGKVDLVPRLMPWVLKGLVGPVALVALWNLLVFGGLLEGVSPLVPGLVVRGWKPPNPAAAWLAAVGTTALGTSGFWGALSLAWLLPRVTRGELDRGELRALLAAYGVIFLLPAAGLVWWLGPWAGGFAGMLAAWPLLQFGSPERPPPQPSYGRAIGRMKRGRYAEAETEVLARLEECETDFQGWMLLAGLYAEHFHELGEADATIRDLASQENLTPYEISQAFNRLADWHLKLGGNPVAARAALEQVVLRCEGTPFALTARNRMAQLPRDREELLERNQPQRVALPPLSGTVRKPADRPTPPRERLRRLRERLAETPEDPDLHEEIAILRARELGEADEAIRALESRLRDPATPPERHPAWRALLAEWHLHHRKDPRTARAHLEHLVREHPESPHALAASGQLWALDQQVLESLTVDPENRPAPKIVVRIESAPPADPT